MGAGPVMDEQGEDEIGGSQLGGHGRLSFFFINLIFLIQFLKFLFIYLF